MESRTSGGCELDDPANRSSTYFGVNALYPRRIDVFLNLEEKIEAVEPYSFFKERAELQLRSFFAQPNLPKVRLRT